MAASRARGAYNGRVDGRVTDGARLLAECDVDTYRGPGPGGQKRNKTDSAVRLRHRPTGTIVVAGESRSQAQNLSRALERLQEAVALRQRRPLTEEGVPAAVAACIDGRGRLAVGRRDRRYLPCAAVLLDLLLETRGSVSEAAARIGVTSANLSSFLTGDGKLLAEANRVRAGFGLKPLRRA